MSFYLPAAIVTVILAGSVQGGVVDSADPRPRFEIQVLGTAQDGGLPHLGCEGPCCSEARAEGRELWPVSLGVRDVETGKLLLVEATPRIEGQIRMLQAWAGSRDRGRQPVDAILITHAHIGHYLGLAQLGREVASTRAVPVFVTSRLAAFLRGNGPWDQLVRLEQIEIHEIVPGEPFEPIPGLRVVAVPVPHRDEYSDTMAFEIAGPSSRVVFVPDIDNWNRDASVLDRITSGADAAFVDATFYDGRELPNRNLSEIPHPLMTDTMDRLSAWGRENPGVLRFIHMNHTNPVLLDPAIRKDVLARGFGLAARGDVVPLP